MVNASPSPLGALKENGRMAIAGGLGRELLEPGPRAMLADYREGLRLARIAGDLSPACDLQAAAVFSTAITLGLAFLRPCLSEGEINAALEFAFRAMRAEESANA